MEPGPGPPFPLHFGEARTGPGFLRARNGLESQAPAHMYVLNKKIARSQKLHGIEKYHRFLHFCLIYCIPGAIKKISSQIDAEFYFLSTGLYLVKLCPIFQKLRSFVEQSVFGALKLFGPTVHTTMYTILYSSGKLLRYCGAIFCG